MRLTATIRTVEDGVLAECSEYAVSCVGASTQLAVAALREALYERVVRPQAVAPPATAGLEEIEVVLEAPAHASTATTRGPQGPGEAPPSEAPPGSDRA